MSNKMENKLLDLAHRMNEVFPHLNANLDDGAISFQVDVVDNSSGEKINKAFTVYLYPQYLNDIHYNNPSDTAEIITDVYKIADGLPEEQKLVIGF